MARMHQSSPLKRNKQTATAACSCSDSEILSIKGRHLRWPSLRLARPVGLQTERQRDGAEFFTQTLAGAYATAHPSQRTGRRGKSTQCRARADCRLLAHLAAKLGHGVVDVVVLRVVVSLVFVRDKEGHRETECRKRARTNSGEPGEGRGRRGGRRRDNEGGAGEEEEREEG